MKTFFNYRVLSTKDAYWFLKIFPYLWTLFGPHIYQFLWKFRIFYNYTGFSKIDFISFKNEAYSRVSVYSKGRFYHVLQFTINLQEKDIITNNNKMITKMSITYTCMCFTLLI